MQFVLIFKSWPELANHCSAGFLQGCCFLIGHMMHSLYARGVLKELPIFLLQLPAHAGSQMRTPTWPPSAMMRLGIKLRFHLCTIPMQVTNANASTNWKYRISIEVLLNVRMWRRTAMMTKWIAVGSDWPECKCLIRRVISFIHKAAAE